MQCLESRPSIEFATLLQEDASPLSRALLVTTFLAILELTRLAVIRIYQGIDPAGSPRGPIHLRSRVEPGDRAWSDQIADSM